jgi:hypothetical protein
MPYTITITEVGGDLIYTGDEGGAGAGFGTTNGPKSHRVFRNSVVLFTSPEGPIGIRFKNTPRHPFKAPNDVPANQIALSAAQGALTSPLTVKNSPTRRKAFYSAGLFKGGTVFVDDPELEDGGTGGDGGGPAPTKKAYKKTAKKKSKKK